MSAQVAVLFLMVFNLADYQFTVLSIAAGARELNPAVEWMFSVHPAAPLVAKAIVLFALLWYTSRHEHNWLTIALWFCAFVYAVLFVYQLSMLSNYAALL